MGSDINLPSINVSTIIPAELEIAQGLLTGFSKVNIIGNNDEIDISSVPEFITESGGIYTGFPLDVSETIDLFSSDSNDNSSGSGARAVTIFGLDENWDLASEQIILNGVNPVTSLGLYRRLYYMSVSDCGDKSVNSTQNAGTITARHTNTTANVFLSIIPGINNSNYSVFTVPAGKTGHVIHYNAQLRRGNAAEADGAFWVRPFGGCPQYRRPFSVALEAALDLNPYGGNLYTEKTDIAMVITAVAGNNTSVTAGFDIILIDN